MVDGIRIKLVGQAQPIDHHHISLRLSSLNSSYQLVHPSLKHPTHLWKIPHPLPNPTQPAKFQQSSVKLIFASHLRNECIGTLKNEHFSCVILFLENLQHWIKDKMWRTFWRFKGYGWRNLSKISNQILKLATGSSEISPSSRGWSEWSWMWY